MKNNYTYVTLLSSNDYIIGVIMLYQSLKSVKAKYPLFVLCSDNISSSTLKVLEKFKIEYMILSEHIVVNKGKLINGEGYGHWDRTFDKLYVWTLLQFSKVVYVDSDMYVIRNIDHLFNKPHMSAVIADKFNEPGLDKLNSGLIVINPNKDEFIDMKKLWESGAINLDNAGDQDVIRYYYSDWGTMNNLHLSSGYNVFYSDVTLGLIKKEDVDPVSVIHYIGTRKPWMRSLFANLKNYNRNFLGFYFFKYLIKLYFYFPICILPQRFRKGVL